MRYLSLVAALLAPIALQAADLHPFLTPADLERIQSAIAGRLVALKIAGALRANPDFKAEIDKIRHDKPTASDAK